MQSVVKVRLCGLKTGLTTVRRDLTELGLLRVGRERNRWQWSRGVDVCILWVFKDRAWAVMEGIQAMHGSVHCFLYKSRVGLGGGCKVEVTSRSRVGAAMLGWGP